MNTEQRAAAERLADALDRNQYDAVTAYAMGEAAALLRELLAEPAQEPVAWFCGEPGNLREVEHWANGAFPVYTHPPQQRKPLTDEQIDAVTREQWGEQIGSMMAAHRAFARAIERAITGEQK